MSIVKLNNNGVKDATAFGSITGLGNLIFIKKQTASGSASISFVDGASSVVLDNTYKEYIFYFNNIHPATSGADFVFNMSVDTGSNYNVTKTTTYFRAAHSEGDQNPDFGYVTGRDLAQSTSDQILGSTLMNDADAGVSGYLHLFDPSSSVFVKHFNSRVNIMETGAGISNDNFIAGYANTTSAVDAVIFKMSSGNCDTGTISLYGVA